jgi:hypothetical protein
MGRSSNLLFRALADAPRYGANVWTREPPGMACKPCSGAIRCTGRACKVRKAQASTPGRLTD